jgi:CheY-like chemotaxis protein
MATILIVDDEKSIRAILKFQLAKSGHQVIEAADGEEALSAVKNQHPELIFLDILLPRKDGWQVCKELKSDPQARAIPIVLLTGSREKFAELRGWECGADEYLTKPWEPVQLHQLTERLLAAGQKPR